MDIFLLLTLIHTYSTNSRFLTSSLTTQVSLTYLIFMLITQYRINSQIFLMSFNNLRSQQSCLAPEILGIISFITSIQKNGCSGSSVIPRLKTTLD